MAAVVGLSLLTPLAGAATAVAIPDPEPATRSPVVTFAADLVALPRPAKGTSALRLLGHQVDEAAELNGMRTGELREVLRTDPSAWLTTDGLLHFKEPLVSAPSPSPVGAASYPLEDTFALHSLPGSAHTIFIDVDGATVGDTAWHAEYPATPTTHPAWDPSGNGSAFSDTEKALVQSVWERVAEDYAPFDVDVTTEDPGAAAIVRSDWADEEYGAHVVVSPSGAWSTLCEEKCAGVALIGAFDQVFGPGGDGYGYGQPAWVFPQKMGPSAKYVAEAVSHEVGHQLGLTHDGNATEEYDEGRGSWAPIMGAGYYRPLSQWSQGSYPTATNDQDDVAIIESVVGGRPDEAPSGVAGAPSVPVGAAYVGTRADVDTYLLGSCRDAVTVTAQPVLDAGANLDLRLQLLDDGGNVLATNDPPSATVNGERASGLGALVTSTLTEGRYHVAVDGVGHGSWSDGYDDYGSLGAYTVSVVGDCSTAGRPSRPEGVNVTGTTTSAVSLSWSAPTDPGTSPVTGYVLTRTGTAQVVELGPGATSHTWTGLTDGTTYAFTVAAVNDSGTGATASVAAATVSARPSAPRDVGAVWYPPIGGFHVEWTAPTSDGGTPVGQYYLYADGHVLGWVPGTDLSAFVRVAGPGSHTIGVAAANDVGIGPVAGALVIAPDPPTNDAFAQRTVLAGASGSIDGDNSPATADDDDPAPPTEFDGAGGASVWYSWTAVGTGEVTFTTMADDPYRDTILAAYTGASLTSLTEVAGNDDIDVDGDFLSEISFPAVAGTTYAIAVDGNRNYMSGIGEFTLSWTGAPPAAATTTSLVTTVSGTTVELTARVDAGGATPTGSVQFRDGGSVVGGAPVVSGVAVLRLAKVTPGRHSYAARFVPSGTEQLTSSSPARAVTITIPRAGSLSVIKAPRTAKAWSRPTVRVTVRRGSAPATGSVVLTVGAKKVTLTLRAGVAAYRLPKVKAGKLKLSATYLGNASTVASKATATITVRKR